MAPLILDTRKGGHEIKDIKFMVLNDYCVYYALTHWC